MSEEDWERIQSNEPEHVTLNTRKNGKEYSQMSKHTPLWWELERIQPNEPAHATLCLRRIGKEYSQMNQHTSLYIWGGLGKDTPKWTTTRHFISEENLKEYSQMNQHMSLYIWGGLGKNTAKWTSTCHFMSAFAVPLCRTKSAPKIVTNASSTPFPSPPENLLRSVTGIVSRNGMLEMHCATKF